MTQSAVTTGRKDGETLWAATRERLRRELGDPVFDAWLGELRLIGVENGCVTIGASKPFVRNWVANRYAAKIERALRVEGCDPRSLSVVLAPATAPSDAFEQALAHAAASAAASAPSDRDGVSRPQRSGLWSRVLRSNQSFDNLAIGPANEFAYRAARAFGEGADGVAPLLYVYGAFGYGKTHILNATALEALRLGRRALLLGGEDFMRQFLGAVHRRETLAFKDEVRAAEMLLIDDLQHIGRSPTTISEFLHTVNAFSDLRRPIVIAADRAPDAFDALGPDVRSRLTGGLVIGLNRPDRTMRLAILKSQLADFVRRRPDVAVPGEVVERIADVEDASPRELIGVLNKLAMYADLTKRPVTIELAEEAVGQRGMPARPATIDDIQRRTADFYKLDVRDLHSKQRGLRVARPRQVAMYLSRELTVRSLPEIGRHFGGRDHTTVLHACRRIVALCAGDAALRQQVDFLKQVLSKSKAAG